MNLETEIAQELWQAIRRSYESQAWSNAILDSVHYLSDAVRARTGLQSDGVALAGQALGGKDPKLRLNRLQTDSEKNIQVGVEQRSCPEYGGKEKWRILPVGEVHDQRAALQGGHRRNTPWARVSRKKRGRRSVSPSRSAN